MSCPLSLFYRARLLPLFVAANLWLETINYQNLIHFLPGAVARRLRQQKKIRQWLAR